MIRDLILNVECGIGASLASAVAEMIALADRLDMPVQTKFNGHNILVVPGESPHAVIGAYGMERAFERRRDLRPFGTEETP